MVVDARGLSCPIPVIKTKQQVDRGVKDFEVLVNTAVARDNVTKFALSQGYKVEVVEEGKEWRLHLTK